MFWGFSPKKRKVGKKMENEKLVQYLLNDALKDFSKKADEKIESLQTSFDARIDGLKAGLNGRIGEVESILGEKPLVVNFGTIEKPIKEITHSAFPKVLNIIKSQRRNSKNIMLVGEAGSGKTHLCSMVAKALGLTFYPMSVGLQTTKSDLLGFINATGGYVTSPVREAFEKGGVLLLDEFDSAHAGVVTIINSLLANGHCSFPDKVVMKHPKFVCIVACNTYGHGANIDYVGRNRLDGATLDRFVTVHVGYDEQLERALTKNDGWFNIIQHIRRNIEKQGIKMIVSPRASMDGADLLEAGFKVEEVVDMVVLKGADKDTKTKALQDVSFDLGSETITVPKKKKLTEYVRDLDKNQTYVIRLNSKGKIDSIKTLNAVVKKDMFTEEFCIGKDIEFHIGYGWCWQFSDYGDKYAIYLTTTESKTQMDEHSFSDSEKHTMEDFLGFIKTNKLTTRCGHDIVFEVIPVKCRNPKEVIVIKNA